MGCDIHLFIEYCHKDDKRENKIWESFSEGSIDCGRNYMMFGYLTNGDVRYDVDLKYGISPRGLPDDDLSYFVKIEYDKMSSELHNPSWLTFDEYKMILNAAKKDEDGDLRVSITYIMILKVMKEFEKKGYKTRIVFWFDS